MRTAYFHFEGYRKYNYYQKYGGQHWEDVCGWLAGKEKAFILDWTLKKVMNYTNINHPCPLEGYIYLKYKNISVDHFPFEQLMPSGRYRLDVNLTESKKENNFIAMLRLYMSVSDLRIEQY